MTRVLVSQAKKFLAGSYRSSRSSRRSTDAHALANFPSRNIRADGVDNPDYLVAGNTRILNAWKQAILGHGIAVADSARLHLDAYRTGFGLGNLQFNQFQSDRPL